MEGISHWFDLSFLQLRKKNSITQFSWWKTGEDTFGATSTNVHFNVPAQLGHSTQIGVQPLSQMFLWVLCAEINIAPTGLRASPGQALSASALKGKISMKYYLFLKKKKNKSKIYSPTPNPHVNTIIQSFKMENLAWPQYAQPAVVVLTQDWADGPGL